MSIEIDLKQLVESMGDAVIVVDANGRIILWNGAATRIFGHEAGEALGQDLHLIIPERLRGRHDAGFVKSMETGTTRYGTTLLKVPAAHKDGRTLSIAFTVAMLFDADHKAIGVASNIRDETARFNEDRELKKRLAALEAATKAPPQSG
jgi:PAS domain S-box-containing protein